MHRPLFFALAGLVLIVDQATKYWIVSSMDDGSSRPIIQNVLYLTRTTNTGAAFGVLPHATIFLALIALFSVIFIVAYAWRTGWPMRPLSGIGLALPLGGALGNFVDRVRLGHVTDFIEVHIGTYVWPIFNVADSAICVGVALLIALSIATPSAAAPLRKETQTSL